MHKQEFHKILDQLCEWRITADTIGKNENGTRKKIRKDHSEPIVGYEVVLSYKPREHKCGWCHGTCSKEKTFSRSPDSHIWKFHCKDCKETWPVTAQEILHPPIKD